MKKFIIFSILSIFLLILAPFVFSNSLSRPLIEKKMTELLGRNVTIKSLEFSLLKPEKFSLNAKIKGFEIQNVNWGKKKYLIDFSNLEISFPVIDLFKAKFLPTKTNLSGLNLSLEKSSEGENWEFTKLKSEKRSEAKEDICIPDIGIGEVEIKDSSLYLALSDEPIEVAIKKLNIKDFKTLVISLFANVKEKNLTVDLSAEKKTKDCIFKLNDLSFDDSDLKGNLSFSKSLSKIKTNLNSKKLNLASLKKTFSKDESKVESKEQKDKEKKEKVFSSSPLGLNSYIKKDLDINLEIDELVASDELIARNISLGLNNNKEGLVLDLKKIDVFDGSGAAKINLIESKDSPKLFIKSDFSEIDAGALFSASESLKAKGSLNLNLTAKADSMRQIAETLNGQFKVVSEDGTFELKILRFLTANVFEMFKRVFGGGDTKNPLHCFIMGFEIKDGIANTKSLVIHGSDLALIGEGDIDFSKEKLEMLLKTRSNDPSIASLIVPLSISGSFLKPSILPAGLETAKELVSAPLSIADGAVSKVTDVGLAIGGKKKASGSSYCKQAKEEIKKWEEEGSK